MPPLLEAIGLSKHYGSTIALESVSFEVPAGVTGLLGPNGAGKSTAIKLFLGLIRPTAGSAEVLGTRPYESTEGRARLGYMPEHDCLPSNTTASEFLMHMAQVSGLPPAHARTRAADILRHVGLDEERYRLIGEYSTGMKQRVKLAQALVHDPVLVLLDEPTAGIMLSTHLMGDVEQTADYVIVLEGGRVAESGSLSEFTGDTASLIVEVDDHRDEVMATLIQRGITVTQEGNGLVIEQAGAAEFDSIRDVIAQVGARLRRLSPRRLSLTDLFRNEPR
jgi:ABC-2 type transport system ATP-binding protein